MQTSKQAKKEANKETSKNETKIVDIANKVEKGVNQCRFVV
jgi:hypothetical protein